MITMTMERESVLSVGSEFLQEFDEEFLNEDEIAEIEAARAEVAAGDFYTLEEFNRRMAVLR